MARGAKYSQSFRSGGQYDFTSRLIISGSENPDAQQTDGVRSFGSVKDSANSLAQNTESSRVASLFAYASSVLVENEAVSRVVIALRATEASVKQATSATKSRIITSSVSEALIQKTVSVRTFVSNKSGLGTLVEYAVGVYYYFKYSAPFTIIFGNKNPNPFSDYSNTGTFQNPTQTSFTTGASAESFREDGVSSYEDGQHF